MSQPESPNSNEPDAAGSEHPSVGPIEQDSEALLAAEPDILRRRIQELLRLRGDLNSNVTANAHQIDGINQALLALSARHFDVAGTSGMTPPEQE